MTIRRSVLALGAVAAIAAAGCGGDIAQQMLQNEQLRTQVVDAIGTHRALALQVVDRLVATDSMRVGVVDHLLHNDGVAKQVIVTIARNPDALDLVLGAAVHDSAMRVHVMTLFKGMQLANAK